MKCRVLQAPGHQKYSRNPGMIATHHRSIYTILAIIDHCPEVRRGILKKFRRQSNVLMFLGLFFFLKILIFSYKRIFPTGALISHLVKDRNFRSREVLQETWVMIQIHQGVLKSPQPTTMIISKVKILQIQIRLTMKRRHQDQGVRNMVECSLQSHQGSLYLMTLVLAMNRKVGNRCFSF